MEIPCGKTGPFYRISGAEYKNVEDFKEKASFSRVDNFLKKMHSCKDIDGLNIFFEVNSLDIEMDPEFKLLERVKTFFPETDSVEIENTFKKISESRWLGLTQPKNFEEAYNFYFLKHLIGKETYLHELWFSVRNDIPNLKPMLLSGKVKDGTSMQFKMNNHAILCVSELTCLEQLY